MRVTKEVRDKRISQISNLYHSIILSNEVSKEKLYKLLEEKSKNDTDNSKIEKEVTDFIFQVLNNNFSNILQELKEMYSKSFDNNKDIKLEELFYNSDGKTLEDRIKIIFDEFDKNNLLFSFYRLCLILDTESNQIITNTMKNKLKTPYVEIIAGEGCDVCNEYCDGEVYNEDDIELPPYHPSCQCQVIYYEEQDIVGDI